MNWEIQNNHTNYFVSCLLNLFRLCRTAQGRANTCHFQLDSGTKTDSRDITGTKPCIILQIKHWMNDWMQEWMMMALQWIVTEPLEFINRVLWTRAIDCSLDIRWTILKLHRGFSYKLDMFFVMLPQVRCVRILLFICAIDITAFHDCRSTGRSLQILNALKCLDGQYDGYGTLSYKKIVRFEPIIIYTTNF